MCPHPCTPQFGLPVPQNWKLLTVALTEGAQASTQCLIWSFIPPVKTALQEQEASRGAARDLSDEATKRLEDTRARAGRPPLLPAPRVANFHRPDHLV